MSKIQKVTIIQCYAPTNVAEQKTKEEFYNQLQSVIEVVSARDTWIVMRDMNAKVGCDNIGRQRITGK